MGRLNYASGFIPKYKELVKPLEALLGRQQKAVWKQKHTTLLNTLLALVFHRLQLHLPDPYAPILIYPGVRDDVSTIVMTQR